MTRKDPKVARDDADSAGGGRAPKGYVPVLVGPEEEQQERFLVSVEVFRHPCFVSLLEMAAQEFGYRQRGVLRIPCDARRFRRVLEAIDH